MTESLFDGPFGAVYSFYMQRPGLSRAIGRVVWGGDTRPFYDSMTVLREVPDGALVVDAPCGAGVAFGALPQNSRTRYVALDISPAMLARARRRAAKLGLHQIELVQGDAEHLPVENGSADLFLSYWGLHCLPHPERAVREIARCLRPGGRVVGAMICQGPSLRQRLLVRPGHGDFGPVGTPEDLAGWLDAAGLRRTRLDISGPFTYFEAAP